MTDEQRQLIASKDATLADLARPILTLAQAYRMATRTTANVQIKMLLDATLKAAKALTDLMSAEARDELLERFGFDLTGHAPNRPPRANFYSLPNGNVKVTLPGRPGEEQPHMEVSRGGKVAETNYAFGTNEHRIMRNAAREHFANY